MFDPLNARVSWAQGADNSYTAHCIKSHPNAFAGIGLLVGKGMHDPADPANPARLHTLVEEQGFSGLRLSPIYDAEERAWLSGEHDRL